MTKSEARMTKREQAADGWMQGRKATAEGNLRKEIGWDSCGTGLGSVERGTPIPQQGRTHVQSEDAAGVDFDPKVFGLKAPNGKGRPYEQMTCCGFGNPRSGADAGTSLARRPNNW